MPLARSSRMFPVTPMAHVASAAGNVSGLGAFTWIFFSRRHAAIGDVEGGGHGAGGHRSARKRVQRRAMKSQKSLGPEDVARVIEIGGEPGNNQHRRPEARQAILPRLREGQRRECVCERFHGCAILQEISD